MELTKVESSNINAVGYINNELVVRYNSGATYAYSGVDHQLYEQLLQATSKGQFINSMIKPKYSYRRLSD